MIPLLLASSAFAATPTAANPPITIGWSIGGMVDDSLPTTHDTFQVTVPFTPWLAAEGTVRTGLRAGGLGGFIGLYVGGTLGLRFGGHEGVYGSLRVGQGARSVAAGGALGWMIPGKDGFRIGPEVEFGKAYYGTYAGVSLRMAWSTSERRLIPG